MGAISLGLFSLMYVGIFGAIIGGGAGFLGSLGPAGNAVSSWGSNVQGLSLFAPLLAIGGGIVTLGNPIIGGLVLGVSAFLHYQLLGVGSIGQLFVFSIGATAALAIIAGLQQPITPVDQRPDTGEPAPANQPSASSAARVFDRAKWNALLKYDTDVAAAAEKISPFGSKWMDELASSFLTLNDKSYLNQIVEQVSAHAKAEMDKVAREQDRATRSREERAALWRRRLWGSNVVKFRTVSIALAIILLPALVIMDGVSTEMRNAAICTVALERARQAGAVPNATALLGDAANYYSDFPTTGRRACDAQVSGSRSTIAVIVKCDDIENSECLSLYGVYAASGEMTWKSNSEEVKQVDLKLKELQLASSPPPTRQGSAPAQQPTQPPSTESALERSRAAEKAARPAPLPSPTGPFDLSAASNQRFLATNATKPGVTALPSGLQYRVIRSAGTGRSPTANDVVNVAYKGWLIDGTVFDETLPGQTATFPAGALIPGWVEALLLMKEGDEWEIVLPSDLGYGEQGAGGVIPPNQTLIFNMALLGVQAAQ